MEEPITRAEYEEYQKRIEDEDHRQNKRIEQLEENTKQINALTVSIEKLAQSVESMVKEQEAQGKRLVSLESKDGEMWRKVVGYVITTIIGIAVGFMFTQIGMYEVCMRKRRGFHLWKNIKKAIGKVGTLNLVLILMFAFFIWFN